MSVGVAAFDGWEVLDVCRPVHAEPWIVKVANDQTR